MATVLENLETARDSIAAKIAEIAANPKPSYSIDGQTFDWPGYMRLLTEQLEAVDNLINRFSGPNQEETIAIL